MKPWIHFLQIHRLNIADNQTLSKKLHKRWKASVLLHFSIHKNVQTETNKLPHRSVVAAILLPKHSSKRKIVPISSENF